MWTPDRTEESGPLLGSVREQLRVVVLVGCLEEPGSQPPLNGETGSTTGVTAAVRQPGWPEGSHVTQLTGYSAGVGARLGSGRRPQPEAEMRWEEDCSTSRSNARADPSIARGKLDREGR